MSLPFPVLTTVSASALAKAGPTTSQILAYPHSVYQYNERDGLAPLALDPRDGNRHWQHPDPDSDDDESRPRPNNKMTVRRMSHRTYGHNPMGAGEKNGSLSRGERSTTSQLVFARS